MAVWIKKHIISLILLIAGAAGGFAYWYFIGCSSGSCPIKSVWYLSTIFGAVLGYLVGGIIEDQMEKKKQGNK
jgi:outer membrane lipoprotein SlyB